MRKLFTGLALASAIAFVGPVALACDLHEARVTADVTQPEQSVAMSTHDGILPPPAPVEEPGEASAVDTCAEGGKDCAQPTE